MTPMAKKPKSGPPQTPKEGPSPVDDAALWEVVAKDVKPLAGRKARPIPSPTLSSKAAPKAKATPTLSLSPSPVRPPPVRHSLAQKPSSSLRPAPTDLEAGVASGLDRRTMTRLGRGRIRPDATIDLHGRTQAEARQVLDAALIRAEGRGYRCILVITGTGLRREGSGVLRAAVPRWLNEAPNRERALGFAVARPEDGGLGAIYVYLKRKKRHPSAPAK